MPAQVTPPSTARSDRIPPYSEEAERGVLGSALLDAARVIDLAIERGVTHEAFYVRPHQVLFEILEGMTQQGRPIDLLTIGERLKDLNRTDEIGGVSFLDGLVDSTPTSAHAEYYIDIVRQKYLLRKIIDRARVAIDQCFASEEEADSILGKTEQSFFEISEMKRAGFEPWPKLVKKVMEDVDHLFQTKKDLTGIPTGFYDMDKLLRGLQPSDMIVLAARPSMGKTSLALNIAENAALGIADHTARPVAVFSLEMSREQLVRRMICSRAQVPSQRLSGGYLSTQLHGNLVAAADALTKAPIYLDDTAGLEVLELRSRARRMQRNYGVQLIVIDYLQMLNYPQFAKEGRQRETAAISGALKAMAKELRVPVLVLSQLSRAPETRSGLAVPKLSDLRDSGSIEQDADVVLLLRRPCKYPEDEKHDDRKLALVEVAKHRNGPTDTIELNFEEDYTRFENRSRGGVDQEPGAEVESGGFEE